MSPPNDRRIPRYQEPAPHEVLAKLKATIDEGHRQMEKIEESALSGHYADRAATSRGIGRMPDAPSTGYAEGPVHVETLNRGYGGGISGGPAYPPEPVYHGPKTPAFKPPHIRVLEAEQRVIEMTGYLEALVDRIVGPQPETDSAVAHDPNPWGGSAGEIVNACARIGYRMDRMSMLLKALETTVP